MRSVPVAAHARARPPRPELRQAGEDADEQDLPDGTDEDLPDEDPEDDGEEDREEDELDEWEEDEFEEWEEVVEDEDRPGPRRPPSDW